MEMLSHSDGDNGYGRILSAGLSTIIFFQEISDLEKHAVCFFMTVS